MTFDEWWATRALSAPEAALPLLREAVRLECKLAWEESRRYVGGDAKDAARYQWIKQHARHVEVQTVTQLFGMGPTDLDRVLDAAIQHGSDDIGETF